MNTTYPRVLPVGETAFTVEFGDTVDAALNRRVHALDDRIRQAAIEGIVETVPTYRSLLVIFDPLRVEVDALPGRLWRWAAALEADPIEGTDALGRRIEVPVQYGGEAGPDLDVVAAHCGMDEDTVIRLHAGVTYTVAMLGFAPGFAYLLGLPTALTTPRLDTPRARVPPGSVGIAGSQTGVYALGTPGGWRIIGRTSMGLFDPAQEDPFAIKAGDRLRFVPIQGD